VVLYVLAGENVHRLVLRSSWFKLGMMLGLEKIMWVIYNTILKAAKLVHAKTLMENRRAMLYMRARVVEGT
jgi:hypothetical protein